MKIPVTKSDDTVSIPAVDNSDSNTMKMGIPSYILFECFLTS